MMHKVLALAFTGTFLSALAGENDPRSELFETYFPQVVTNIIISYLPQTWSFIHGRLQDPDQAIRYVQLFRSAEGSNKVMTINMSNELFLWDIATGGRTCPISDLRILSATVSPTGNVLAYVSQPDTLYPFRLHFFDLISRQHKSKDLEEIYDKEPSYAFSSDGTHFASAGNAKLKIWDINNEISRYNPTTFNIRAKVASLAPQGDKILLRPYEQEDSVLGVWRITKNKKGRMDISLLWFIKQTIYNPKFSPCGTYVLGIKAPTTQKESASKLAHSILLLNPSSGAIIRTITHAAFPSPLHSYLMSSDEQRTLFLPTAATLSDGNGPTLARLHIVDITNRTPVKYYAAALPQSNYGRATKLVDTLGPWLAYVDPHDNRTVIIREQYGLSGTPAEEEDEADQLPTPQSAPSSKPPTNPLYRIWQRLSDASVG
jgi:hypothetical protein